MRRTNSHGGNLCDDNPAKRICDRRINADDVDYHFIVAHRTDTLGERVRPRFCKHQERLETNHLKLGLELFVVEAVVDAKMTIKTMVIGRVSLEVYTITIIERERQGQLRAGDRTGACGQCGTLRRPAQRKETKNRF